jgi:hypothetical protein
MTVKEMRALLKNFPEDMRLVSDGYNYGYDDISELAIIKVKLDTNVGEEWYGGRHRIARDGDIHNIVDVLCIGRGRTAQ